MKRISIITSLLLTLISVVPSVTLAQSEMEQQLGAFAGQQGANFAGARDPRVIVADVIRYAITLVGTLFLAYTVYAGYLILMSRGEEEKLKKGKSTIRTAIIGVLVTLSAYAITVFIARALLDIRDPNSYYFRGEINIDTSGQRRYQNPDPLNPPGSSFGPDGGVLYR